MGGAIGGPRIVKVTWPRSATGDRAASGRGSTALRLADRYVGIPLVAATGLIRKKRHLPSNPEQIGLLNTAAIGDTVLMSAVIADLRDRYGQAKLILFTGPSNHEVAHLIPELDLIVMLDIFNPISAIRQIRRYDLAVLLDFGPWPRLNSIIAAFSGAQFIAGFKTRCQYRHFAYDLAVEHSSAQHELENFRRLAHTIDAEPIHMPSLQCPPNFPRKGPKGPRGYIIFHMWPGGAGSSHKEWPQQRWRALAETLIDDGYGIALTGSRQQSDLNGEFISRVGSFARPSIVNIAGCNFSELANELRHADLVVSVNTGVMHMADALSPSLVALHGPTNPRRWGPLSATSIALESPLAGSGYLDLGFEFPRRVPDCMSALSFDTVLTACRTALLQTKLSRSGNATLRDSI
jgi:ADP-heptose:LPS heptosyltransferase